MVIASMSIANERPLKAIIASNSQLFIDNTRCDHCDQLLGGLLEGKPSNTNSAVLLWIITTIIIRKILIITTIIIIITITIVKAFCLLPVVACRPVKGNSHQRTHNVYAETTNIKKMSFALSDA